MRYETILACLIGLPSLCLAQGPDVQLENLGTEAHVVDSALFGFDVHLVDLGAGSNWQGSELWILAQNGARFRYPLAPRRVTVPDLGAPLEDAEKYQTFVNTPWGRDLAQRYRAAREPDVGSPRTDSTFLNVSYSSDQSETQPGYIGRVVLDLSTLPLYPGLRTYVVEGEEPFAPGDMLVASGFVETDTDAGSTRIDFSMFLSSDCNGNGIIDSSEDPASDIRLQDCDNNGIRNGCEEGCDENGNCLDCNNNGVPDTCDIIMPYQVTSPVVPLINERAEHVFSNLPRAGGLVTLTLAFKEGIRESPTSSSSIDVFFNGSPVAFDNLPRGAFPTCTETTRTYTFRPLFDFMKYFDENNDLPVEVRFYSITEDCDDPYVQLQFDYVIANGNDCNVDGVPDDCSPDCDQNGIADQCDDQVALTSSLQGPLGNGNPQLFSLPMPTASIGSGQLRIFAMGGFEDTDETLLVRFGGADIETVFTEAQLFIPGSVNPFEASVTIPEAILSAAATAGVAEVELIPSSAVVPHTTSEARVELLYQGDCNTNGQSDRCEIADNTASDCNADGQIDACSDRCNCAADLDQNGMIDLSDLSIVLANFGDVGLGDVNGDQLVNLSDLAEVLRSFNCCCDG